MDGPPRTRLRASVGAIVVLLVAGLAGVVLVGALGAGGEETTVAPLPVASVTRTAEAGAGGASSGGSGSNRPADSALLLVHVVGAVQRPGLYELRDGDRVVDAVSAAGGLAADAEQAGLNLAQPVADGEQIVVPRLGEAPVGAQGGTGNPAGSVGAPGGRVNLNTADAAALDALPGIGPALAQRIVDWRTKNGRFTSVEDLDAVSGIGPAVLERLRDLVTV